MIEWPPLAAKICDSALAVVAIQKGGRGFCVGRGSEVTLSKLWNWPWLVTFSCSSSRRICSMPS